MSQKQISTLFFPTPGVRPTLRQDSPRPKTSSENLVCHALKRLQVNPSDPDTTDKVNDNVNDASVFHTLPSPRRDKSSHFTVGEKMDALEQALVHGIPATSRRLNIPSRTLDAWRKDLVDEQRRIRMRSPITARRNTSGRKLNFGTSTKAEVADLTKWLSEIRIRKKPVSAEQMLSSVKTKMGDDTLQAKRGWLTDFMTRHGLTLGAKERMAIQDTDKAIRKTRMEPSVANDDGCEKKSFDADACRAAVVVKREPDDLSSSALSEDVTEAEDCDFFCMRG
ncbi:uncharacterized protein LOC124115452 [Haliotis rufescens]|uniref:uncharacterized protein LOC124115452 n=1 Tax=Haliotis rufescens TaxID=6454 RepID=UPI00201F7228|nr:uncharacterized protein LOC124115452 [Haliotis rufescens]